MILVSACLAGVNCRYDGKDNTCPELVQRLSSGCFLPLCPEQLGGLPTPRIPAEIQANERKLSEIYRKIVTQDQEHYDIIHNTLDRSLLSSNSFLNSSVQVINQKKEDVTIHFLRGALETLRLVKLYGVRNAILKARSPSCGYGTIYDGTFTRRLTNGIGITAALLQERGINIFTEEQLTAELLDKLINEQKKNI